MEDLQLIRKELAKKAEIAHAKLQKEDHFLFQKMDVWLADIVINGGPSQNVHVDISAKEMETCSVEHLLKLYVQLPSFSPHQLFDIFCQTVEEEWFLWFHSNLKALEISYMDEKIWFMEVERVIEEFDLSPRFGSALWRNYLNRPIKNIVGKWEQKVVQMGRERALEKSRELAKIEIENTVIVHLDKKLRQQKTRLGSWQEAWLDLEHQKDHEELNDFMLGIFAHSNWFDVHYDPNLVIWVRQRVAKPSWCDAK